MLTCKLIEKVFMIINGFRCINDILVSVGQPDLFRTDSVNNTKSVKIGILWTLSDQYAQERKRKATIPRKGNLLFNDNLNLKNI